MLKTTEVLVKLKFFCVNLLPKNMMNKWFSKKPGFQPWESIKFTKCKFSNNVPEVRLEAAVLDPKRNAEPFCHTGYVIDAGNFTTGQIIH